MEFISGLLAGGFFGVAVMAAVSLVSRDERFNEGYTQGYKRGVTELEPFVKDLQLREWVGRLEETQ